MENKTKSGGSDRETRRTIEERTRQQHRQPHGKEAKPIDISRNTGPPPHTNRKESRRGSIRKVQRTIEKDQRQTIEHNGDAIEQAMNTKSNP